MLKNDRIIDILKYPNAVQFEISYMNLIQSFFDLMAQVLAANAVLHAGSDLFACLARLLK